MPRPPRNRQRKPPSPLPADVATAADMKGITPLEYMLAVMRNPKTSQRRRDRMAVTAARYIHSRPADVGKKDQRAAAADGAGVDTEWFGDLERSDSPRRQ